MVDAQQARESAAGLASLSNKMGMMMLKQSCDETRIALRDAVVLLDTEHDRLIDVATDLEAV